MKGDYNVPSGTLFRPDGSHVLSCSTLNPWVPFVSHEKLLSRTDWKKDLVESNATRD